MEPKISVTNSKLGHQIPSVSLPPELSCRKDAPCARMCYGKKGNFTYSNVKKSFLSNWEAYQSDPVAYFDFIERYLCGGLVSYKYFRWHSVGDIPDVGYLAGMIRVANRCPSVRFLCFTKRFDMINAWVESGLTPIPDNLKIVFSAWGKGFRVPNPHGFPVAHVRFRDASRNSEIPELAIPCGGKCPECLACWSLKPGQSVFFDQH